MQNTAHISLGYDNSSLLSSWVFVRLDLQQKIIKYQERRQRSESETNKLSDIKTICLELSEALRYSGRRDSSQVCFVIIKKLTES